MQRLRRAQNHIVYHLQRRDSRRIGERPQEVVRHHRRVRPIRRRVKLKPSDFRRGAYPYGTPIRRGVPRGGHIG